jgi:hypothetical protein
LFRETQKKLPINEDFLKNFAKEKSKEESKVTELPSLVLFQNCSTGLVLD